MFVFPDRLPAAFVERMSLLVVPASMFRASWVCSRRGMAEDRLLRRIKGARVAIKRLTESARTVEVRETTFFLDVPGRYVCNIWDEATNNGGPPFDAVVLGAEPAAPRNCTARACTATCACCPSRPASAARRAGHRAGFRAVQLRQAQQRPDPCGRDPRGPQLASGRSCSVAGNKELTGVW